MYGIERKAEIINLLEQEGEVDVNSLSSRFGISKETVRRDLRDLEREGILTRTHGGGVFNREQRKAEAEYPLTIRGIQRFAEKNAICRYAASLIQDGDTIFIDNSSTTMYLVQYIPRNLRITVLTNSLKPLLEAAQAPNPNVHYVCLGGIFKESNFSFYGNTTLKNAQSYYPNRCFLSCAGIREDGMMTDSSMQEVDTKQLMIDHSKQTIYLVDYTKFTTLGPVFLAKLRGGNHLVTDDRANPAHLEPLKALGAEVTVVPSINRPGN